MNDAAKKVSRRRRSAPRFPHVTRLRGVHLARAPWNLERRALRPRICLRRRRASAAVRADSCAGWGFPSRDIRFACSRPISTDCRGAVSQYLLFSVLILPCAVWRWHLEAVFACLNRAEVTISCILFPGPILNIILLALLEMKPLLEWIPVIPIVDFGAARSFVSKQPSDHGLSRRGYHEHTNHCKCNIHVYCYQLNISFNALTKDGFSNIYWRIYTEESAGLTPSPEGPANGYTILKHFSRLKDLELRLRNLDCLVSCYPRRLGLWIFSATPDFESLSPLCPDGSSSESSRLLVGSASLKGT